MSKVEKALRKASALQDSGAVQEPELQRPELEPEQELIPRATELQPYKFDISRMTEPWQLSASDLAKSRVIFPEMEDIEVADSFRALRSRILHETGGANCTVLVASVTDGGGGSFVALNLAVAFTFDDARTALLIDCDLRTPAYDYLVAPVMQHGLTDYLESPDLDPGAIVHPAGIPRLRVIPAGRRSETATEKLDSKRMRELAAGVKARYPDRCIVLNGTSARQAADVRLLAGIADYVVLVVPFAGATETEIWEAAQLIDEKKLLGVVFNNEPQLPRITWN